MFGQFWFTGVLLRGRPPRWRHAYQNQSSQVWVAAPFLAWSRRAHRDWADRPNCAGTRHEAPPAVRRDVLRGVVGRRLPRSLGTNADDRLPLGALGRIEGGNGVVQGCHGADV